jgi:hypothetical protein
MKIWKTLIFLVFKKSINKIVQMYHAKHFKKKLKICYLTKIKSLTNTSSIFELFQLFFKLLSILKSIIFNFESSYLLWFSCVCKLKECIKYIFKLIFFKLSLFKQNFQILMMSNWKWYMGDILESFVWLSMDHSKDNFENNYLIFSSIIFFLLTFVISICYLSE